MPKARQKVRPNEAIARAINAEPWEPEPGMVKKQCSRCRYFFAVPLTGAEATSCCPDCARPICPAASV